MTSWTIERILHFDKEQKLIDGYCHFGFHDQEGNRYILDHDTHWIGSISQGSNTLKWTAGNHAISPQIRHIYADIINPTYLTTLDQDTVIIVSSGNNTIFKFNHRHGQAELLIDGQLWGLKDVGNCEYDPCGFLWINEVTGCRVHKFDLNGKLITTLGNGEAGFQVGKVSFEEVQFNWIFDLRRGSDGNLYVLDSRNFCVRMIDPIKEEVTVIAGTGIGGYTGDNGLAINATLGSSKDEHFDGPWSLSLDEQTNLYIGDTQNHVVRMVDRHSGIITTIAGTQNITYPFQNPSSVNDPFNLQLQRICSLDYHDHHLFIPEWDGDLIVLNKPAPSGTD